MEMLIALKRYTLDLINNKYCYKVFMLLLLIEEES